MKSNFEREPGEAIVPYIRKSDSYLSAKSQIFSLATQRILNVVFSLVGTEKSIHEVQRGAGTESYTIKLSAQEFIEQFGNEYGNNLYAYFRKAAAELSDLVIQVQNGEGDFIFFSPYPIVKYEDGVFQITISQPLGPNAIQIWDENSRMFQISSVSKITSKYTCRLYELLMSYLMRGLHEFTVDLTSFRAQMGLYVEKVDKNGNISILVDMYKDDYRVLNKKILKPCVEEINKVTDLFIDYCVPHYDKNKRGCPTVGIDFSVYRRNEMDAQFIEEYDAGIGRKSE